MRGVGFGLEDSVILVRSEISSKFEINLHKAEQG